MSERGRMVEQIGAWGLPESAALDLCLMVSGLEEEGSPLRSSLSRVIEAEIVPRLLLTHRGVQIEDVSGPERRPDAAEVAALARVCISEGIEVALAQISAVRERGNSTEVVFLDLLAPTARLLGDMWVDDLCSFADVTVGLSRLQQVLRILGRPFREERGSAGTGRILLSPVPGEQHSFGLSMMEEFFARGGWDVEGGPAWSESELSAVAGAEHFDVIGLSLSSDILFPRLRTIIASLRRASRNRDVVVMVGGRFFADRPELAAEVGADLTAASAPEALLCANSSLRVGLARS